MAYTNKEITNNPDQQIADDEYLDEPKQLLQWPDAPFYVNGLCRINTPHDRDQVYHAILNAMSSTYRETKIAERELTSNEVTTMLREDLAQALALPDHTGKAPYYQLMNGQIEAFARSNPGRSLRALQQDLLKASNIPRILIPFVCDFLDIDLYMIDFTSRQVEPLARDLSAIYKGRESVVLMYTSNHYHLVGIQTSQTHLTTFFKCTHPFIVLLQKCLEA